MIVYIVCKRFVNPRTYRAEPYNSTAFGAYAKEANAPALPESLRLYKRLQSLGIKPVILTGRREDKRESTAKNLARAGYTGYLKLLVKYVRYYAVVLYNTRRHLG